MGVRLDEWVPTLKSLPVAPRPRLLSPSDRRLLEQSVSEWNALGIIIPSSSWILHNPVFVEKKNGSNRTCIDYRPVNAVCESFDWPLPKITHMRHQVKGFTCFSRMDIKAAFHRIIVPPHVQEWTAFRTHLGPFQFTRMPFGLKTAPSVFQRHMDWLLQKYASCAIWYIDDILIMAHSQRELRRITKSIRHTIQADGMEIAEPKSEYDKKEIDFVGLRVSQDGIGTSLPLSAFEKFHIPTTKPDRQSFLGFANCFRDYVVGFSALAAGLYPDKNNETRSEKYADDCRSLIAACMSHVSLAHYDDNRPGQLFVDASGYATGAVLSQDNKICAIQSKSLNATEQRYSATDREALALVRGVEAFRVFIQSNQRVITNTDHTALLNRVATNMSPRQQRWRTRVENVTQHLVHVKGVDNPADYWSRRGNSLAGGRGVIGYK